MSKLSSFVVEEAIVGDKDVPGAHFAVRGVNFNDLTRLMINNAPIMMKLYTDFIQRKGNAPRNMFTTDMVKEMLMEALKEAPELVFSLIAMAADDDTPEGHVTARRLPMGIQIEALEQIIVLSIKTEAELKKLQEAVLRGIEALTAVAVKMNLPKKASELGFGKSVKG